MSKRNRKKVSDLEAGIDSHPGTPLLQAFQSCEIAKDAFEVSALQVRRLLLSLENPNRQPEDRSHGVMQNSGESFKEVLRRLLHFLASAESLVRTTEQTVQRDFIAQALRLAHKEAVASTFHRPPAACFMRDIQSYMRNRTDLPMVETRYTVPRPKYI